MILMDHSYKEKNNDKEQRPWIYWNNGHEQVGEMESGAQMKSSAFDQNINSSSVVTGRQQVCRGPDHSVWGMIEAGEKNSF